MTSMTSASDESDLKGAAAAPAVPVSPSPPNEKAQEHRSHHLHSHHAHHHGARLLEFVHPHTGRTTHVVHTPEDLEKKRRELARQSIDAKESLEGFDLVLHGSPEHHEAIRDLHSHHQNEHEKLKEEHPNVFEKFEHVRNELDILNAELHMLTDHSVALDASFDKFGYSAHLRTKDDSETSSLKSDSTAKEKHQDRTANPLKFFKRPVVRQYFHKGLLWRSARSGEVPSFELFIDLVYVGVIDIIGEKAVEHPGGLSLLHFVIVFSIGWKIWADMTNIINWFDIDDIFQRICVAFYLICLFGFCTNIFYMFEEEESTYKSAVGFYIAQRLFLGLWYLMVARLVPMIRGTMLSNSLLIITAVAFWIGSMHVHWPNQLALIFIGIVIDLFGGIVLITIMRTSNKEHGFGRWSKKWFEFFPAVNIEHRVERNNAFVALVFGYSILTILYQSHSSFGINAFFGKGVLGLIQAFAFNWIYFEIDAYGLHVHAIRRHWLSASLWTTMHLPFIMSYILAAATLSGLVLAHDCPDANEHDLGEHYEERSLESIPNAMRWFYCGGLGVALFSMGIISLTHVHKRLNKARLMKRPRLAIRGAVSVIIICLPLADHLNSLELIAITTCLTLFILILDLYGNSAQGSSFWTGGCCHHERKSTSYFAHAKMGRHRRREIQRQIERGERVGLADLLKRHSSMSSIESGSGTSTPKDEEWTGGHY